MRFTGPLAPLLVPFYFLDGSRKFLLFIYLLGPLFRLFSLLMVEAFRRLRSPFHLFLFIFYFYLYSCLKPSGGWGSAFHLFLYLLCWYYFYKYFIFSTNSLYVFNVSFSGHGAAWRHTVWRHALSLFKTSIESSRFCFFYSTFCRPV